MKTNLYKILLEPSLLLIAILMHTLAFSQSINLPPASASIQFSNPVQSSNMSFVLSTDPNAEAYTEAATIDGVQCRKIPANKLLYLTCNRTAVPTAERNLLISITYYGNSGNEVWANYNSTSNNYQGANFTKVKSKGWITTVLVVTDAALNGLENSGGDFRLGFPSEENYIREIKVSRGALNPDAESIPASPNNPNSSFKNKSFAGYQIWHKAGNNPSDWSHWSYGKLPAPGSGINVNITSFPDLSEYPDSLLYPTNLGNLGNGKPTKLYNDPDSAVINRQMNWLKTAGPDGVAIQRFVGGLGRSVTLSTASHLTYVKNACEKTGKLFYIMYDLNGADANIIQNMKIDWVYEIEKIKALTSSPNYATVNGKPVVSIWGIGYDGLASSSQCSGLISFLQSRGCYVIGGTPSGWRTSPATGFADIFKMLNNISPWTVGVYGDVGSANSYLNNNMTGDKSYCDANGIDYLPVIFPGSGVWLSTDGTLSFTDRQGGKFLWHQMLNAKSLGLTSVYFAMLDEFEESTNLIKGAVDYFDIPVDQYFETFAKDGIWVSPDFYLRLSDKVCKTLRGSIPLSNTLQEPYSNGPAYFRNSFESKFTTFTMNGTSASRNMKVDPCFYNPAELSNTGMSNPSVAIVNEASFTKSGIYSVKITGAVTSGTSANYYYKVTDNKIRVKSNMQLSFWKYAVDNLGQYTSVDLIFQSGKRLKDLAAYVDNNGNAMSPTVARGTIGGWQKFTCQIGSGELVGDVIIGMAVGYDHPSSSGNLNAYFDDIILEDTPVSPNAPVITSAGTASGAAGDAFSYTITASNNPSSFGAVGLPSGLSINTGTGIISGTPTVAGAYNVTLTATNSSGTTSKVLMITLSGVETPYAGSPAIIPGRIEAEDYDDGGEGIAYHDNDAANNGGQQRVNQGVDVGGTGDADGNYDLGWIGSGEWLKYTVNVSITGTYILKARVSSPSAGKSFHVEIDGTTIGTIAVPNTGGWNTYQTVSVTTPSITGGNHIMRIYMDTDGFNLNYVNFSITPPVITSATTATGTVAAAFAYNITATNSPTNYSATDLPAGLILNAVAGVISGTPTTAGTFATTINATNSGGTGSIQLTITINAAAPVISSASTATGTLGTSFTYNITASNNPTSYDATGLPTGLTVNTTTGVISGTPTTAGTYNATASATNAVGTGTKQITITINTAAPVISSASTATGTVGTSFTYSITASNNPTSYDATSLPTGLTVNTTTGVISGAPTTAGTFNVTVSATNTGGTGSKQVTITINPAAPVINSASTATGTVGTSFTYSIIASNNPTSYNATSLPTGLTVNTTTGVISGTPTTVGTYNATASATNAGGTGTKQITITINAPAGSTPYLGTPWPIPGTIEAENYDDGGEGVAYHDNDVINNGGQQRTNQGVDIENTGDATGTYNVGWTNAGEWLKYTVNVMTAGTYTLQARVASPYTGKSFHIEIDGATVGTIAVPTTGGWQAYQTVTVTTPSITAGQHIMRVFMDTDGFNINNVSFTTTIASKPSITSATTASATLGVAFTYNITASNSPTSYGATSLPSGLSVNTSTGLISGTPVNSGTYNVTISATNASGTGSATLSLTVSATTDPSGVITCYKAPGTVTVDGSLTETGWNVARPFSKTVLGTPNNTATFGVLWDNNNLYIGVKVLDANLFADSPNTWDNDAVEVYIDANYNKLTSYDGMDNQIIKGYNNSGVFTKFALSGLQHAWATISGGYAIELAVPWSKLGISAPTSGVNIGFEISYDDDDNGGTREGQAVWNGTVDDWQNTSGFGRLTLSAGISSMRMMDTDEYVARDNNSSLYPNPVAPEGTLNILVPQDWINEGSVTIWNGTGVLVFKGVGIINDNQCQLKLNNLKSGVYFIQIANYGKMISRSFIVQ